MSTPTPPPPWGQRRRRIRTGNRDHRVVIGMTKDEFDQAERLAGEAGLSTSSYLYVQIQKALLVNGEGAPAEE